MTNDRRLDVLRAIVEDYVATQEPVGSKALVERHRLGVSPATVRNDMAALEDEGYIMQPHTSAGRIPTDRGYRLFVDSLDRVKPLSAAERRAIEGFLTGVVDLDEVIQRTVRLLAQVTRQVAVVRYPLLSTSTVRQIELVPLSQTRLVLLVVSSSGRVDQSIIEVVQPLTDDDVADLRTRLNNVASGRLMADVPGLLADLTEAGDEATRESVAAIVAGLSDVLLAQREDRLVIGGAANLAAKGSDVYVASVLEALEEQVVLLHLFDQVEDPSTVTVRIGAENEERKLQTTSTVSSVYGVGQTSAQLGVVGPTRMDYPATMSTVAAVARYLSRFLSER